MIVLSLCNISYASGETTPYINVVEETSGERLVYKDSKYRDVSKTFKGTVVNAGVRYEDEDEWVQDLIPYQDVRIRIEEKD